MQKVNMIMALITALAIGCATGVILRDQVSPNAVAQQEVAPGSTNADSKNYSECIGIVTKWHAAAHFNKGKGVEIDRVAQIPPGWTPIGGGGIQAAPVIIACR